MGFLFIEPNDPDETTHIFPAYYGKDKKYHTFSDEKCKNSIEWIEDIINNQDKIKRANSDDNEAICHGIGVTVNDMGKEVTKHYCNTQSEVRTYAANRQNTRRNICGNCVKRFYKD